MYARNSSELGQTARQFAKRALGTVSPRLLRKVQLARVRRRFHSEPVRGPRRVQLETTTACNYHCLMCTDHSPLLKTQTAAKVLPWEQVESLLREAAAMGAKDVWFAGRGEPLCHPQAVEIVALASSLGLRTMVTTNGGRLTEAVADALCEANLSELSISINSGNAQTYAEIHGVPPGERERILSVMERISQRSDRPWLYATMVILRPNVPEMVSFARDAIAAGTNVVGLLGLRWGEQFFPSLVPEDSAQIESNVAAVRALTQQAGVRLELHDLPGAGAGGAEEASGPEPPQWRLGCFVGHQFTRVDVHGRLHGCCSCGNDLAALDGSSLAEAWHSPDYQEFRRACRAMPRTKAAPAGCNCAACGNLMDNEAAYREMGWR